MKRVARVNENEFSQLFCNQVYSSRVIHVLVNRDNWERERKTPITKFTSNCQLLLFNLANPATVRTGSMYTEASITMDGKPCLRGPNWMLPSFHLKKRSSVGLTTSCAICRGPWLFNRMPCRSLRLEKNVCWLGSDEEIVMENVLWANVWFTIPRISSK